MANQIGQIRYTGSGCLTNLNAKAALVQTSVGTEDSTSTSFQDVMITPNGGGNFNKYTDYYLKVGIPQDVNYDMSFNIKLIKNANAASTYQFLKKVSVPKGGTGENNYKVVLYSQNDNNVEAMIPLSYRDANGDPLSNFVPNKIYYDKVTRKYYIGISATTAVQTTKVNEVTITASWKTTNAALAIATFEVVFRPVEDVFTGILLEMERTPEDYTIQNIVDNKTVFGRVVNISKVNAQLYYLKNLVPEEYQKNGLSRIGIWGRPGLVFVVNGEGLRIGPSSYYELDVLPITSLGIVAEDKNYKDNWTLDYTYSSAKEA